MRVWRGFSLAVCAAMLLAIPASAQEPPVFLPVVGGSATATAVSQDAVRELDSFHGIQPGETLLAAIEEFKQGDPDASFSFFNGHVDSFATRPKNTIPGYALPVLAAMGLPTSTVPPAFFPDPATTPKAAQNLDSDPTRRFPWSLEAFNTTPVTPETETGDTNPGDPDPTVPPVEPRLITPPIVEPRDDSWQQPSDRIKNRFMPAVEPILANFLKQFPGVFELPAVQLEPDMPMLRMTTFHMGRFYMMVKFSQLYGEFPLLDGDLSALFDSNWNVVGISRMVMDPGKLAVDLTSNVDEKQARAIAIAAAVAESGVDASDLAIWQSNYGVSALRRHLAWQIGLIAPAKPEIDITVLIDARTGVVLNVGDNVNAFYADTQDGGVEIIAQLLNHDGEDHPDTPDDPGDLGGVISAMIDEPQGADAVAYTDARVRRWAYTDGDVRQPFQVTTSNMYVRDDNTLTHDFFYSANEQRTNGTLSACADQGNKTTWPEAAWDSFGSSTFIRHTHRADRDFSLWSPAESSGTFAESHNYFWSRAFFQWLKPALKELGVLPSSASNYPKVLMITNACIDDIGYASGTGLEVSTQHNEGESSRKIRIADACRQGNAACAANDYSNGKGGHYSSCDGTGCMATPSIIQHEINHYILAQFFGVGSSLDCNAGDQLRFLHEGTMGSVIPQAFWHHYYGVGYAPSDTDRLFTMDEPRGRVHVSNSTLMKVSDWYCSNNTTVTSTNKGPYNAGRVPAQVLWKFYHGIEYNGSTPGSLWRPATDTDFLILTYWAADLVAASTYKDRYEVANRIMEILDKHSNWTSNAKADYCQEWAKHELDNYINDDYCS